jgi:hypothetical protein
LFEATSKRAARLLRSAKHQVFCTTTPEQASARRRDARLPVGATSVAIVQAAAAAIATEVAPTRKATAGVHLSPDRSGLSGYPKANLEESVIWTVIAA